MKKYDVVSITTVKANSEEEAVESFKAHARDFERHDAHVIIYVEDEQETSSVGRVATKALIGIARAFNRTLVIRCDNQFRPYVMDYPKNNGRPYDVSLNVSEVVGHYKDHNDV